MDGYNVFYGEVGIITEFPCINCFNILMTVIAEVNPVRFIAFGVKIVKFIVVCVFAERAFQALGRPFESAQ